MGNIELFLITASIILTVVLSLLLFLYNVKYLLKKIQFNYNLQILLLIIIIIIVLVIDIVFIKDLKKNTVNLFALPLILFINGFFLYTGKIFYSSIKKNISNFDYNKWITTPSEYRSIYSNNEKKNLYKATYKQIKKNSFTLDEISTTNLNNTQTQFLNSLNQIFIEKLLNISFSLQRFDNFMLESKSTYSSHKIFCERIEKSYSEMITSILNYLSDIPEIKELKIDKLKELIIKSLIWDKNKLIGFTVDDQFLKEVSIIINEKPIQNNAENFIKLNLNKDYGQKDILDEIKKLHPKVIDTNTDTLKKIIFDNFIVDDYRKKLRNITEPTNFTFKIKDKIAFIEFFWVLQKENILSNSFSEIAEFLSVYFKNQLTLQKESIEKIPSEKDFPHSKNYKNTPSLNKFFKIRRIN